MKVHKRHCNPVEEIHKELGDITSSIMYDDDEDRYELLERKDVLDSNGFWTEYSLYYDIVEDRWVTVFGDSDIYGPEDEEFDAEFDNESEAYEWFESYEGLDDEEY